MTDRSFAPDANSNHGGEVLGVPSSTPPVETSKTLGAMTLMDRWPADPTGELLGVPGDPNTQIRFSKGY